MVVYFKFWLELESRDEFLYRTRCDKRDYTRHSQLFLGGSAHTPNLLFGKDPGNLRDARNSLSPVVNHRVLDECTNVRWLDSYVVSLVAYMCTL